MDKKYHLARTLRKKSTKQEQIMWNILRNRQFYNLKFKRQFPIGDYIVDFACEEKKIVIELDGSQHYEEKGKQNDLERDNYLRKLGIKVLRYSNLNVNKNFEGVCADISKHISSTSSGTSCHLPL